MEEIKAKDFKPGVIPYLTLYQISKMHIFQHEVKPFFYTNKILNNAFPLFSVLTLYGEIVTSKDHVNTVTFKTLYGKTKSGLIKSDLDITIELDSSQKTMDEQISLSLLNHLT